MKTYKGYADFGAVMKMLGIGKSMLYRKIRQSGAEIKHVTLVDVKKLIEYKKPDSVVEKRRKEERKILDSFTTLEKTL